MAFDPHGALGDVQMCRPVRVDRDVESGSEVDDLCAAGHDDGVALGAARTGECRGAFGECRSHVAVHLQACFAAHVNGHTIGQHELSGPGIDRVATGGVFVSGIRDVAVDDDGARGLDEGGDRRGRGGFRGEGSGSTEVVSKYVAKPQAAINAAAARA